MIENYKIDISKNIINESKSLRITELIYTFGFLFVALFYIIYTLIKGESFQNYFIGLTAFLLFIIKYLQINGNWIYKKYFSITEDGIKWQKTFFIKANLKWSEIDQINFEFPSIDFHLTTKKIKHFSLLNITGPQINEAKKLIRQVSIEKGIKYTAK